MRKFLLIILICLLAVAAFLFLNKELSYTPLMNFVPKDAVYIMETEEPVEAWEKLSSSSIWQHLQTQPTFANLTQSANSLDTLIKQNKAIFNLLGSRKVLVSAHLYKPNDYDFLFVADLAEAAVFTFLEQYISNLPLKKYRYTKRKSGNFTVHELQDKMSKDVLHLAFINNALVASWQAKLVENAIKEYEIGELSKNNYFTAISHRLSNGGMFRIYLQYSYLDEFMRCYTSEDNEYVKSLSQTILYTGLDCTLEEDSVLQMKGYTNINDSIDSYLQALAKSGKGKVAAFNVIPQRSAFFLSLGFADFKSFFDNFKTVYQKQKPEQWAEYQANLVKIESYLNISLEENFMSWMGEEVTFLQTQPKGLGRDNEMAVIISVNDVGDAKANLDIISDQIRKKTPVKFRELEYNGFTIKYMAVKGFFKLLMGKFFEKLEKPYYTFIDGFVIFSNHPQTLKDIINDYKDGKTLAKSKSFDAFFENFSSSSNVFLYTQTPILQQNMKPLVSQATWDAMQTNRNYVQCFDQIGFQLIEDDGVFETKLLSTFTNPNKYPEYFTKLLEREVQIIDTLIAIEKPLEIILDDLDDKKYTESYPDGTLKVEVEIKNGLKNGTYKEYFPDGELKIKGDYRKDQQEGTWRYYDENGNLIKKKKFRNGQEISQ